ncbi:STY4528 family pathogenicity island replication protein [Allopusillimonas ginsengisoli]|uniref:STY4528 family pathogenicity island replication protein n=1 Tax=Allopusillimonas ginsengisoli TaxID=453575 RepID=UPI0039C44B13
MVADHDASRHDGPILLSNLLDGALTELSSEQNQNSTSDGFLYSGNRHESVPRRLFLDRRLTPLERNAWQVFRLLLNDDGVTAFPTYDQLRPWLASMPCGAQASHETVARALTLLRLTRWLSLVRRRRDPKTGRILGNLYVLHDEPLTPFEAMQLDPDYLELVSQSLSHSAKAVQIVGLNTLQEIADDPLLQGRTLPSRLYVLAQRMQQDTPDKSYPQEGDRHESEAGRSGLLRNVEAPSSESEPGVKPASNGTLPNPKQDRTVRKVSIKEVRTAESVRGAQNLRLPQRFGQLKQEQQAGTLVALRQVDESLRQAVLDEWAARCHNQVVRNPAGYLFGIIQRAISGDFKPWAGKSKGPAPTKAPTSESTPREVVPPEVAMEHLNRLRELVNKD